MTPVDKQTGPKDKQDLRGGSDGKGGGRERERERERERGGSAELTGALLPTTDPTTDNSTADELTSMKTGGSFYDTSG